MSEIKSRGRFFMLSLFLVAGCATVPHPQLPGPEASKEERLAFYDRYAIRGDIGQGYYQVLSGGARVEIAPPPIWMSAQIDWRKLPDLKVKSHHGYPWLVASNIVLGTLSLGTGVWSFIDGGYLFTPNFLACLLVPEVSLGFDGTVLRNSETNKDYDDALREKLNLVPSDRPNYVNDFDPKEYEDFYTYFQLSSGVEFLSNDDMDRYFGWGSLTTWDWQQRDLFAFDLGYGIKWNSGFTLEFGVDEGPERYVPTYWPSTPLRTEDLDIESNEFYISPAMTFANLRLGSGPPLYSMGLRLGLSEYDFRESSTDANGNDNGDLSAESWDPVITPWFRFDLPFPLPFWYGIEFGYRYAPVYGVHLESASGIFSSPSADLKDYSGNNASFDFSGPYVRITSKFALFSPKAPKP